VVKKVHYGERRGCIFFPAYFAVDFLLCIPNKSKMFFSMLPFIVSDATLLFSDIISSHNYLVHIYTKYETLIPSSSTVKFPDVRTMIKLKKIVEIHTMLDQNQNSSPLILILSEFLHSPKFGIICQNY